MIDANDSTVLPAAEGSFGRQVLRRVVPLLGGRVATMAAQFLSLALIGRTLGPSEFGILQVALVAFVYLTFLGDLGVSVLGTRDNQRLVSDGLMGAYVGARLILGLGAAALALLCAALIGLEPRDFQVVAVLAIGLIASSASVRWLLQAREKFGRIGLIDSVGALVQLGSAIALAVHGGGLVWAAATMASASIISALLTAIVVRRSFERPHFGAESAKLIRLALPAGVAVFATSLYFSMDSILIGAFRGAADVGYYGAAYRFVFAALALPTVANAVALPVLSRLVSAPRGELHATLSSTSHLLMYISLPLAAATSLLSGTLVELSFGSDFAPATPALAILIWTCVTVSANTPFAALMLARRQDGHYMMICVAGSIANLGMNVIAIPVAGILGAAVTSIATEIIVLTLIVFSTADVSPRILLSAVRWAILPTVILALTVWPLRQTALAIPVGVVAWAIAGLLVGPLRPGRFRALAGPVQANPRGRR